MIAIGFGTPKKEKFENVKIIEVEEIIKTMFNGTILPENIIFKKRLQRVLEELYRDIKDAQRKGEDLILLVNESFLDISGLKFPFFFFPMFKHLLPDIILVFDREHENTAKILSILLGVPYKIVKDPKEVEFLAELL